MNLKSFFHRVKQEYHIQDVTETNREFPRTFLIPSREHLSTLKVGDLVKLIFVMNDEADDKCRAERMWLKITSIEGSKYKGQLDNQPYYLKTVQVGDEIEFIDHNIAEIYIDDIGFDATKMAIMTKRAFDERQINWVVRSSDLFNEQDSGWQLFYGDEDNEYLDVATNSMIVELKDVLRFEPLLEVVFRGNGECFEFSNKDNCFVQPES